MRKRRILSILMALALCLSLLPATALAGDATYSAQLSTFETEKSVSVGQSFTMIMNAKIYRGDSSAPLEFRESAYDFSLTQSYTAQYKPVGDKNYTDFNSGVVTNSGALVKFDLTGAKTLAVGRYTVKVTGTFSGSYTPKDADERPINAEKEEFSSLTSEATFTLVVLPNITGLNMTVNNSQNELLIDYSSVGGNSVDIPVVITNQGGVDVTSVCKVSVKLGDGAALEYPLSQQGTGYVFSLRPLAAGVMTDTTLEITAVYSNIKSGSATIKLKVANPASSAFAKVTGANGETAYFSGVAEAVAAAAPGDTVTLLRDYYISDQLTIDKKLTLDLGGKTLTSLFTMAADAQGTARFSLVTTADVTITNGTYVSDPVGESSETRGICQSSGNLTLTNLIAASNGINVCNYAEGGTLTISNCRITGDYAVGSFANKSTVDIDNSQLMGTTCGLYHNGSYYGLIMTVDNTTIQGGNGQEDDNSGVYISGSTTTTSANNGVDQQVKFTNCTISGGTGIEVKYTDLNLTNCNVSTTSTNEPTFEQYNNGSTTSGFAVVASDNSMKPTSPAPGGSIVITGGNYKGLVGLSQLVDISKYPDFKETDYTVYSGTFSHPVREYLADGLKYELSSNNSYSYYADFAEAVAGAQNGGVVTDLTSSSVEKPTYQVYTVTFAGADAASVNALAGSQITLPSPWQPGYTFLGWYLDGQKVESPYTVTGNVTLTAQWTLFVPTQPGAGSSSYNVSVASAANGKVAVSPTAAPAGTLVTVTATPDAGYELASLTVTANGVQQTLTPLGSGKFTFTMPAAAVTVAAVFQAEAVTAPTEPTAPAGWVNPYSDVAANDWFYDAVGFATANGLMSGTSATTFSPDSPMSRAMVWTVLARAAGQTITGEGWAEAARTWAMAAGVSDGTNAEGSISREEIVTMLYRYVGEPDVTASDLGLMAKYADGEDVSAWAQNAMAWALSTGVINGRGDKLAAGEALTRAEAATMLGRCYLRMGK